MLTSKINESTFTSAQRSIFNETIGAGIYSYACVNKGNFETMYSNLYVAMAALAAITKHAGESLKIILFHESLKINFQYLDTLLIIDINT